MALIEGALLVNGQPRSGAVATLFPASRFASPPAKGTAIPATGAMGTVETGPEHGRDGGYRFTTGSGEFWVGVTWNGTTHWTYHLNNTMTVAALTIEDYGAHSIDEEGFETFDSSTAIQAAIDDCAAGDLPEVIIPRKRYRIDSPLIVARITGGNTWNFCSCTIRGAAITHEDIPGEAELRMSSPNLPGIIIQWARHVRIKDVVLTGQNDLAANSGFGGTNYDLLLDNSLYVTGGCRDNRWSPHCGIALDPFHPSVSSGDRYPDLGSFYGFGPGTNDGSSIVELDNVTCRAFVVGYMISPGSGTAQGDVITLKNCRSKYCKVGVAIGQSQSRGVSIRGGEWAWQKYFVSCSEYGQRTGPPPKISDGAVIIATKYLFEYDSQWGTLDCQGLYCESTLSIGFLGKNIAATAQSAAFNGCEFKFHNSTKRPDFHIRNVGPVSFNGCFFNTNNKPLQTWSLLKSVTYHACQFQLNTSRVRDNFASANAFTYMETFEACAFYDPASLGGPSDGHSRVSLNKLAQSPSASAHDHSLLAPGAWITYQSTRDIHSAEASFGIVALTPSSGVALVADGSGGATFFSDRNADNLRIGDHVHTHSSSGFTPEVVDGGSGYAGQYLYVGEVASISVAFGGHDVTLTNCPQSLASATLDLRFHWVRRFHQASTCNTTSGSATITGLTPASSWAAGHRIEGAGIAEGTYLESVSSGGTGVLSRAATISGTGVRVWDSDVGVLTGTGI